MWYVVRGERRRRLTPSVSLSVPERGRAPESREFRAVVWRGRSSVALARQSGLPGEGGCIEQDDRLSADARPVLRGHEREEVANRRVEPPPSHFSRQVDRGVGPVMLQRARVVEQPDLRRGGIVRGVLLVFGQHPVVGLDQRRQTREAPVVVLPRNTPEYRHDKVDPGLTHVPELPVMPRR